MNKKSISVIVMLALTFMLNSNAFAEPTANESTELKQVQDNKKELQGKVDTLNKEIDEIIAKVDNNKNDMNKIAQDIKNTQIKLQAVENNSKEQEDLFKKRVRAMYISGGNSYVEVILGSHSLGDFASRVNALSKIIKFDNDIINKLKERKEAVLKQQQNLNYENSKLAYLKTSNESTLSKLSKDIEEQKDLLHKATEKEKELVASEKEKELAAEKAKELEAARKAKELADSSKLLAANNSTSSTGSIITRGGSNTILYSNIIDMEATAYSNDGFTASGSITNRDANGYSTIAVDPRVIPLGSLVYVEGYGYAVASDTGGAIKGNIIDVFFPSEPEAKNWGRRSVKVYILKN